MNEDEAWRKYVDYRSCIDKKVSLIFIGCNKATQSNIWGNENDEELTAQSIQIFLVQFFLSKSSTK